MSVNSAAHSKPPRTGTEVLESIESLLSQAVMGAKPSRKRESESLLELYKALAMAQKGFSDVNKSGSFSLGGRAMSYAKISDLVEASRAALRANNLVCNTFIDMSNGIEILVSRLYHIPSGQYMDSELPLLNTTEEQKRGSSITYAWRYTYAPLIGLVDNSYDDDGVVTTAPFKK